MKSSSIIASTIAVVPHLEEGRDLAQVRVTHDHVQSSVLLRVGVRFVARVHDRTLQRRLEPDLLLEEVGTLADLVVDRVGAVLAADLARAGEHLAGHEPRQQVRTRFANGTLRSTR